MRSCFVLLCFSLLIYGCDRKEKKEDASSFKKLKKEEVIYYLLLEERVNLAGKTFEEFKNLVVLRDTELFFRLKRIASELEREPFSREELLEMYKTVDIARHAYRNAVDLPSKKQELAEKVLRLEKFSGPDKKEIRDEIRKEVETGLQKDSEFFSVIAHNYVMIKNCRKILEKKESSEKGS